MAAQGEQADAAGAGTDRRPVVAGVDGSDCALEAVRWAAAEARRRGTTLRLVAAWAAPGATTISDPGVRAGYMDAVRTNANAQLETAIATAEDTVPGLEVSAAATAGLPAPILHDESTRAQLLVVGSRGLGGFTGLLIGSVAVALAAHSACPVVVVREAPRPAPSPEIAVGVDDSPASEAAVEFAFGAAALHGARLVAIQTWQQLITDPEITPIVDWDAVQDNIGETLAARLAPWREKFPQVEVLQEVVCDRPARALVEASKRAQLIVVGSRGRGGLKGMLLGSVSQALLRHAHCPVAVIRSGELHPA